MGSSSKRERWPCPVSRRVHGMPGSRCMAVRPGAFVGRGGFVEHLTTPFVMTTLVFAGGGFCKECGGGSGTWQRPFPAPLRWRGARAPCSTWQSQTALGRSWEDVRRTLARTESRNRGDGAPCAPSMFVRPTPQRTCARSRGTHGCLRAGQAGSRQGVRVGGGARCRRGELLCRADGFPARRSRSPRSRSPRFATVSRTLRDSLCHARLRGAVPRRRGAGQARTRALAISELLAAKPGCTVGHTVVLSAGSQLELEFVWSGDVVAQGHHLVPLFTLSPASTRKIEGSWTCDKGHD